MSSDDDKARELEAGMKRAHDAWRSHPSSERVARLTRRPDPGARLVEELRDYLRATMPAGAFRPGTGPITFTVPAAGDGLDVTFTIKVSRRVDRDEAARYRNAALDYLATVQAGRRPRCGCYTQGRSQRGWGRSSGSQCEARPVAALILDLIGERGQTPENFAVRFVCGRHRDRHGFRAELVRALVDLPAASIEGAFQRGRARYEEKRRTIIATGDAKLEIPRASCRRCGLDNTCNSCDFAGTVTAPAREKGSS
jgi:hypothetical protein